MRPFSCLFFLSLNLSLRRACPSFHPSWCLWRPYGRSRIRCSCVLDSLGHLAAPSRRWYAGPPDPRPHRRVWCAPRFRRRRHPQSPRRRDASLQQATPRSVKANVRVWVFYSLFFSRFFHRFSLWTFCECDIAIRIDYRMPFILSTNQYYRVSICHATSSCTTSQLSEYFIFAKYNLYLAIKYLNDITRETARWKARNITL